MRCSAIEGNRVRLDGGSMFGNAPRAVWQNWCEPDSAGRIELATRCLLVQRDGLNVLLETGIGSFFDPALRERYGVLESNHVLLEGLSQAGVTPDQLDFVILSHLHFDHAGGLLCAWRPDRELELAFPRAKFVVSERAWERAMHPHARDRASFIPELVALLQASGRLLHPDAAVRAALGEGFEFFESDGHTPGMLHTRIRGRRDRVLYCADLVPGVPWLHLPITMGYDRFPERLIDEKREVLEAALASDEWLFFTHDPTTAAARVARDARGRFSARADASPFERGLALDPADPR